MIAFFNGAPGSGKSYHGTALALFYLEHGFRVATSWAVKPPDGFEVVDIRRNDDEGEDRKPDMSIREVNEKGGAFLVRFGQLSEVMGLRDFQILKDEAQNDLGSRDWEKLPLKVRIWMSEHRHYRTNLFLYTQHYKFVDIYPRRLALGNVSTITKLGPLTFIVPRPEADSETGELGPAKILDSKVVPRPWKGVDLPLPEPTFMQLWNLGRRVPEHYRTHAPHTGAVGAPPAAPVVARRQPPLL